MELLHKILLWIHIPFGFLSLILFWIPIAVKKGSPLHRKVGWYYFITMWIVLVTAALLSITNVILGNYIIAMFLGYLTLITSYPLWYSYEILQQKKIWSDRYFTIRKVFLTILFITGVGMILLGGLKFHFQNIGLVMVFFGVIVLPAGKEVFLSKAEAIDNEDKIKMHIQGTIISGIAAYTAFLAFGGRHFIVEVLHLDGVWVLVPWILPTILGIPYSWYMKRKYSAN